MKIVVLAGSPHRKGTSNTLVEEFVRGAEEALKKAGVIMTAWNNDDWTYTAVDNYFDTLFSYMHFIDVGRVYGKG